MGYLIFIELLVWSLCLRHVSYAFDTRASIAKSPSILATDCRRSFVQKIGSLVSLVGSCATTGPAFAANEDEQEIEVYFGAGCFWHCQERFVEAERRVLGRDDLQLTSLAGYAGGKAGSKNGKVCYHNALQVSDYASLGHAEVVRVKIPSQAFPEFCKVYFSLYTKDGYRPDQWGDTGAEYRNVVGIPGGVSSPLIKELIDVSKANGDKLDFAKGRGDDKDARALCFVMDTSDFPFFAAEQYHQFHDGFNFGENYPASYNNLASKLAKEGRLGNSQCPNGLLGVGTLGL